MRMRTHIRTVSLVAHIITAASPGLVLLAHLGGGNYEDQSVGSRQPDREFVGGPSGCFSKEAASNIDWSTTIARSTHPAPDCSTSRIAAGAAFSGVQRNPVLRATCLDMPCTGAFRMNSTCALCGQIA